MKAILFSISLFIILFSGCLYRTEEAKTYREITKQTYPLTINMKDSSVITLNKYSLADDYHLSGIGSIEKNNSTTDCDTTIDLRNVNYIIYDTFDSSGFFMVIAGSAVLLNVYGVTSGTRGLNLTPVIKTITYGGGSGNYNSCPFLYSLSADDQWYLEGEVFGTALGKGLELSSTVVLKHLKESTLNTIKITNERPETHYFNNVEIRSVEYSSGWKPYFTSSGKFIEVKNSTAPITAKFNGNNILPQINSLDKFYWVSDRSSADSRHNFEDVIFTEFENTGNKDSVAILLESINTIFSSETFYMVSDYFASDQFEFCNALDNNKEFQVCLKRIREQSALKIDVWNGKEWVYQSSILPEANKTPFTSAAVVKSFSANGKVYLRLRALSDVWKIDNVSCAAEFSTLTNIKTLSPQFIDTQKEKLLLDDNLYFMMLPGQSFEIKFQAVHTPKGKSVSYAVTAKGYLYEWLREKKSSLLTSLLPSKNKVDNLIYIMNKPDWFLPLVYKN